MRPVVNNTKAPTYRLAKKLNDILKQQLKYQYNTQNSKIFAHNINQSLYLFLLILYTRYGKRCNHKTKQCKLK